MVDYHAVSFEIEEAREEHRAIVHGSDGSAAVDSEVEAEVRALRDSIKDPLGSENVGGGGIDWSREVAAPLELGRDAAEVVLFNLYAFGDLCLLLRVRRGELLLDCELNSDFGILCAANDKCMLETLFNF